MSWRVDTSQWPVVIHTVEGAMTNEEVDEYILEATTVLKRGGRHATIMDSSNVGSVSAYVRSRAVEWRRTHQEELKAHCVATAYVLSSPIVRFIAMTVFMVSRLPTPWRVCHSLEEAHAWVKTHLDAIEPSTRSG